MFLFLCKFFKLIFFVGVQKNAEVTSGIDIAYSKSILDENEVNLCF